MSRYIIPANNNGTNVWTIEVPADLLSGDPVSFVVESCCHSRFRLDVNPWSEYKENDICAYCGGIYRDGIWKLEGPPRLNTSTQNRHA